ncbi:MAG: hypothetical protein OXO52_12575 [Rhodospirillales bacterium]|nr:hypothetical protein [Rhodospirillales bacterium]MDE0380868.1 hypothetical protein [Rhodospirillales bacterium]
MSDHSDSFDKVATAGFTACLVATFQALDKLPVEQRTSQGALNILDHVLRQMKDQFDPPLSRTQRSQLDTLHSQLREGVESGPDTWATFPLPDEGVHH